MQDALADITEPRVEKTLSDLSAVVTVHEAQDEGVPI